MTDLGKPSVGLSAEKLSLFTNNVNQAISSYLSSQEIVELGPEYSRLNDYDDAQLKLIHYRMSKNWVPQIYHTGRLYDESQYLMSSHMTRVARPFLRIHISLIVIRSHAKSFMKSVTSYARCSIAAIVFAQQA